MLVYVSLIISIIIIPVLCARSNSVCTMRSHKMKGATTRVYYVDGNRSDPAGWNIS